MLASILAAHDRPRERSYGAILTRLTTAEQLPALHRAIASGALDDDDDIEIELEFGLERILDGVSVLIDRTGSGRKLRAR